MKKEVSLKVISEKKYEIRDEWNRKIMQNTTTQISNEIIMLGKRKLMYKVLAKRKLCTL